MNITYEDFLDDYHEEVLDGKVIKMAPRPTFRHLDTNHNITKIFKKNLSGCVVLSEPDVHFSKKDKVAPDVAVVCNRDILDGRVVHGAPDIVVEILSPSTSKRDRGYKKRLYQRYGVAEYWIVDTNSLTVEVYLLEDGQYNLDNIYQALSEAEFNNMSEQNKAEQAFKFKTHLWDGLIIDVYDIFKDIYEG
ncbi:MAG: Uma2 family endonuclease [Defluviitaleaceae bacterium]|nr:Uma2 family endonuclease [Defluviitaleaceae bacterium]